MNCIDQVHYIIHTLGELWGERKTEWARRKKGEEKKTIILGWLCIHTFFDTYNSRIGNERGLLHWQYSKQSKETQRTHICSETQRNVRRMECGKRILRGKVIDAWISYIFLLIGYQCSHTHSHFIALAVLIAQWKCHKFSRHSRFDIRDEQQT